MHVAPATLIITACGEMKWFKITKWMDLIMEECRARYVQNDVLGWSVRPSTQSSRWKNAESDILKRRIRIPAHMMYTVANIERWSIFKASAGISSKRVV